MLILSISISLKSKSIAIPPLIPAASSKIAFFCNLAACRGGALIQFPISKKLKNELAPRRGERQN
jgi:hypothetical protein